MRFFRCLLGFLLGLLVTAAVLYRWVRPDNSSFEEMVAEAPRCEVLFVGPSYIDVGLNTELFDAETQALGHPIHACKFAQSALRAYELEHDLKRLMEYRWPKLKTVAVDMTLFAGGIGFERENWFTPRLVQWHTWAGLTWLYRYYRANEREERRARKKGWQEVAPLLAGHLQHAAMNYLGIGRAGVALTGARWVEHYTGSDQGIVVVKEVDRLPSRRKKASLSDEQSDAAVRVLSQEKARARARRIYEDDTWARELEPIIRERGFAPIFLYSPVYRNHMPPRPTRPGKAPLVFLDFDDPDRYPELYVSDSRGRTSHLSREGAAHYSRLLAKELVKLATEPQPQGEPDSRDRRDRHDERGKRRRGERDRPDAR